MPYATPNSACVSHAGGEYIYLLHTLGKLPAFLSGWISLIVGFSAPVAATAIALAIYLPGLKRIDSWSLFGLSPISLVAIGIVLLLSLLHALSVRHGMRVQGILTAFKIAFILVLISAGFMSDMGSSERLTQALNFTTMEVSWGAFAVSLIFVSFAYSGWNAASYMGSEICQPERNLPLALILGTLLVSILYLLLNMVFIYALPTEQMAGALDIASLSGTVLFGQEAGHLIGIAVSIGLLSVISAMTIAGPRVYYAMSSSGLFFKLFSQVHPKSATPVAAIWLQATLAVVMIITSTFETLLIYIGFTLSFSSVLTVIGLMVMRQTKQLSAAKQQGYKTFGYPFTPLFFILGNMWIIAYTLYEKPIVALYGLMTILVGLGFYAMFRRGGEVTVQQQLDRL